MVKAHRDSSAIVWVAGESAVIALVLMRDPASSTCPHSAHRTRRITTQSLNQHCESKELEQQCFSRYTLHTTVSLGLVLRSHFRHSVLSPVVDLPARSWNSGLIALVQKRFSDHP